MLRTALASMAGRSRVATIAVTGGHEAAPRRGGSPVAARAWLAGPTDLVNEPAAWLRATAASAPAALQGPCYGRPGLPAGAGGSPAGCLEPAGDCAFPGSPASAAQGPGTARSR